MNQTAFTILLIVCLVGGGYWGHARIVKLELEQQELIQKLTAATEALVAEKQRAALVEKTEVELGRKDDARQEKLRNFEYTVAKTAARDISVGTTLSTVLPDSLVCGLRSFQNGSKCE